jgi:glycosyltransferase involved in cell wall biosynthesis
MRISSRSRWLLLIRCIFVEKGVIHARHWPVVEERHILKILHLYAGNLYGGIETLLATMARLRDLAPEMEPEFGLCFRGRLWDELVASGVLVHDLGPVRLSRPWTVWRARKRLRDVLTRARPDKVIAHDSWPHTVFAPVVRSAGIRLVHFVHGLATTRNLLERLASRTSPDFVIANSRFTAGRVHSIFPGIKVETWHYPVFHSDHYKQLRPAVRTELGTAEETVVILQASRLERWKGQAVHLAALARLRDLPGWECWLAGGIQKAGEGQFLDELRSVAEQAGIANRVRFLGQRADVPRLMAAADVFCQPNSGPEPFGIVLVEALYAGLPVVTSGFGGGAEIVDQTCGVLTKPGDPEALAAVLSSLIREPSMRWRLGAAGPSRAQTLCDPARQLNAAAVLLQSVEMACKNTG